MVAAEVQDQARRGIREAIKGNTLVAQMHLEDAINSSRDPEALAWYGYCIAQDGQAYGQAVELCKEALAAAPRNSDIYLALGKIYLLAGRKKSAISAFNKGLKVGRNAAIIKQLHQIGLRKTPVFSFIERGNLINVYAGLLLSRLGLR